jgi:hypothetical protein
MKTSKKTLLVFSFLIIALHTFGQVDLRNEELSISTSSDFRNMKDVLERENTSKTDLIRKQLHHDLLSLDADSNDMQEMGNAWRPLFAIKTNLLFDLITALNIELEVPIGKYWSVAAEWMFPWWTFKNSKYYNQVLLGTVEGKYWFKGKANSDILTGHALGAYASAGYYDLQWKKTGYQGEILPIVGFSYSYAHKIAKHLRMEYTIGLGVMNTKYRHYTSNNEYDTFPWQHNGKTLWVGPTRAEVSLVWLIGKNRRK